jgi:hypothetical protein
MFHRGLIELPVQLVGDAVVLTIAVDALREAHRTETVDAAPPPSYPTLARMRT